MSEPQDDVSEGTKSDEEVNHDLFKDQDGSVKFFLHESIKKKFARRNLTRDIEVRREPLDLTRLIDSFLSAETRRNCMEQS
jgi:hypothetical protein